MTNFRETRFFFGNLARGSLAPGVAAAVSLARGSGEIPPHFPPEILSRSAATRAQARTGPQRSPSHVPAAQPRFSAQVTLSPNSQVQTNFSQRLSAAGRSLLLHRMSRSAATRAGCAKDEEPHGQVQRPLPPLLSQAFSAQVTVSPNPPAGYYPGYSLMASSP